MLYIRDCLVFFLQPCLIEDCGELLPGEDDGVNVDDGTGDVFAEWPVDSNIDFSKVCKKSLIQPGDMIVRHVNSSFYGGQSHALSCDHSSLLHARHISLRSCEMFQSTLSQYPVCINLSESNEHLKLKFTSHRITDVFFFVMKLTCSFFWLSAQGFSPCPQQFRTLFRTCLDNPCSLAKEKSYCRIWKSTLVGSQQDDIMKPGVGLHIILMLIRYYYT